ncbi:hypothetical protein NP233_g7757 [Leucocoprinus birnbaumii]|uniref:Uncharacterized protein n=1 Tax=Leucocoprinus birnbaumii TaxID=56174 RepID=A0AAD5VRZ8_9AGAR|nr:hypothetical protein NP233_g7757 [Leucocoprinus birnbaumii]
MYIKFLSAFFSLFATWTVVQAANLVVTGNYTISHPTDGGIIVSDGGNSTPIRVANATTLKANGIWSLELYSTASELPTYKIQYQGTSFVAGTQGVPGAVVYTSNSSGTPKFFAIGADIGNSAYQIASDPYKVLVWTRQPNNTITLETNKRSSNQLWNIVVPNV